MAGLEFSNAAGSARSRAVPAGRGNATADELCFTTQEVAEPDPLSIEQIRSELEQMSRTIRRFRAEYSSATHNNPYSSRGLQIEQQIQAHERRFFALKGMLEATDVEALAHEIHL
jgi:hypothetical protein